MKPKEQEKRPDRLGKTPREQAGHESEADAVRAGRDAATQGSGSGSPRSAEDLAVEHVNDRKADERGRRE